MNLYLRAEKDLALILGNIDNGFSMAVTLYDKLGVAYTGLKCFGADIAFMIDANTGALIKGRTVEIHIRTSDLMAVNAQVTNGWQAKFENVNGDEWTLMVKTPYIDRSLGITRLTLEGVKNAS